MLRFFCDSGRVAVAGALLMMGAIAGASAAEHAIDPANPQPKAAALKPGLAVNYYFSLVRTIRQLRGYADPRKGDVGKPLPQLNYHTGYGKVLTTDRNSGVGAKIHGFIKFDKPGVYQLKINSNDGVQLYLSGKHIFEDPVVHSDEMSDPIPIKITTPGWYPILIWYFQRKGTATLELYWQPPGGTDSVLVPASAFAHIPGKG